MCRDYWGGRLRLVEEKIDVVWGRLGDWVDMGSEYWF